MRKSLLALFIAFTFLLTACSSQPAVQEKTSEQLLCESSDKSFTKFSKSYPKTPNFKLISNIPMSLESVNPKVLSEELKNLSTESRRLDETINSRLATANNQDLKVKLTQVADQSRYVANLIDQSKIYVSISSANYQTGISFTQEELDRFLSDLGQGIDTLSSYFKQTVEVCNKKSINAKLEVPNNTTVAKKPSLPLANVSTSEINNCLLPDKTTGKTSMPGTIFVGFPATPGFIPLAGEPKVLLLPVDWSDVPGELSYIAEGKKQAELFSDYYSSVSNQKLNFKWQFVENWVRLPGTSEDFRIKGPFPHPKLIQAAVAAADPYVDFSNVSGVYLLLPNQQKVMYEGTQDHYLPGKPPIAISNEGEILSYVASGELFSASKHRTIWSHWVHESAHFLNMPDLYDHAGQWEGKELIIPIGPFSGFDMMSSQDGPSRTINSWSRFIMGWLDSSQIYCQSFEKFTSASFDLSPIDANKAETKAVIIRLSDSEALVVESRRPTKFDLPTKQSRKGVIVFSVDTTLGHGEGYLRLIAPEGRRVVDPGRSAGDTPQFDAVLYAEDSISYKGITVYVEKLGTKDRVSIIKQ